MLMEILTWMGLWPSGEELAGRPDRNVAEETPVSYEGSIRWGQEMRPGVCRVGDSWKEWTLTERVEAEDEPLPYPGEE